MIADFAIIQSTQAVFFSMGNYWRRSGWALKIIKLTSQIPKSDIQPDIIIMIFGAIKMSYSNKNHLYSLVQTNSFCFYR